MSSSDIFARWHGYRYFEYEKELAVREIEAQVGEVVRQATDGIVVRPKSVSKESLQRLTYVRQFEGFNGSPVRTHQGILEGSIQLESTGLKTRTTSRQQTRYSVHGIHEYKGKFNPQIVRAIANILPVERASAILDPFCGSGTSLVEAAYLGCNAIGLDLNPLAVFMANTKIATLHLEPRELRRHSASLANQLRRVALDLSHYERVSTKVLTRWAGNEWQATIHSYEYLCKWFAAPVLCQLAIILNRIKAIGDRRIRNLLLVIVSDIVRDVSLQDPADLRIRRRKDARPNYPVIHNFIASLEKKVATVSSALEVMHVGRDRQAAFLFDVRQSIRSLRKVLPKERFRAAITSPPYATALPYIDTQRLSLCLLRLIDSSEIAAIERALIGSREIKQKEKLEAEHSIRSNSDKLPAQTLALCRELLDAANDGRHGFRKMNTPGLTYRYFADMKAMFSSVSEVLARRARFALVVGRNRTTFGSQTFVIETPTLLANVAESVGYKVDEILELDAYQRFGLHQKNGITTEQLVILSSPSK